MNSIIRRGTAVILTVAACALMAGCDDSYLDQSSARSQQPISSATLAKMEALDTTPSSPTLIRTYKKEAELEIWKMKSNGEYALLKTYPMCRWSGQLGPKKREGDMQVPEGFYTIAPGQMNPNSHYYLAFNVGYPNAYDRAYGRTGGNVMVHGVCSSAGCFSMTDEQVADIYAIARDSFAGGQREIQLQSYPFHMTAQNMAKFRLDPNIDFWKNLKDGSDHFEVTKNEPSVLVCGKHYVFDATTKDEVSGSEPCPALKRDQNVEAQVAEKENKDEAKVAELAASGRQACSSGLRRRRPKSGFHRLQGRKRPGRAGERAARDRPWRPGEASVGGGESRRGRRGQEACRERGVSARRGRAGRAGFDNCCRRLGAAQQSGMLGGVTGGAKNVQKWLHLGGQDACAPPSPPRRTIPINRFLHRRCPRTATTCIWRRCIRRRPRRRDGMQPKLRLTRPIPRRRQRRRSNSDALYPARAARRSFPIRAERWERRRAASSASASARVGATIGRAIPRPHVNKTAGVFRLFAIGVAQVQCAPVHVKRERFIAERGGYGAGRSKAPDRGLAGAARATNPPMTWPVAGS